MTGLLIVTAKSVVLAVLLLTGFAFGLLMERKLLGWFQYRVGPNRVGPWGLLQPVADAVKAVVKEDIIPEDADRGVFVLAPVVAVFTALAAYAVIPIGPDLRVGDTVIPLSIAQPDAGILVFLAITSLSVYGITLGGWASQSKYALLGAVRSTAQMISYELAMGMSVIGVVALAGSLRLQEIVAAQSPWPFVVLQPIGFLVFLVAAFAETNRAPFDLPEAETELVSGFNTEYSGMRFAMFVMAEWVHMITMSSLITLLYLGGWHGPAILPPVAWFLLKVAGLLFLFIWTRATVPRLRYDRLMSFGWKVLLPLAFVNLLGTAVLVALG